MRNLTLIVFLFCLLFSCNNDGNNFGPPEGQYRLVEMLCFCGPPEAGTTEHWIFDSKTNMLTIRITNGEGQLKETRELFYGRKGKNLLIGEEAEFEYKRDGIHLELILLDDPAIADDELTIKLVSN